MRRPPAPASTIALLLAALALAPSLARPQGGPPGGAVWDLLQSGGEQRSLYAATDNGVFRRDADAMQWTPAGLTGFSVLAIDGAGRHLFAGTDGGGVFRSRNAGRTWEQVSEGLDDPRIRSLAVDPSNPDIVYAGPRDGVLFKTTNGGDSWTRLEGVDQGTYFDIAIDPDNPQTVYAAFSSTQQPGVGALFKTTDGGQQWTAPAVGAAAFGITLDPADSTRLLVSSAGGISVLTDAGSMFEAALLPNIEVRDAAVDPSNPDVLYAATRRNRIVKSEDGGQNFFIFSDGLFFAEFLKVLVDREDPSHLYAAALGAGVFRSTDAAETWRFSGEGIAAADVRAIAVRPSDSSQVLAAAFGGGMFRSSDAGASWQPSPAGLNQMEIRDIAYNPSNPEVVYAGTADPLDPNAGFQPRNGELFRSRDGGSVWEPLFGAAPGNPATAVSTVIVDPMDSQTIWAATSIGILRSDDGGEDFEFRNGLQAADLAIDPSDRETLYAIVFGPSVGFAVAKTENEGGRWEFFPGVLRLPLFDIAVDPNDTSRIWVTGATGVFRSTGNDAENDHFEEKNTGLPFDNGLTIGDIAIDGGDNSALYLATTAGVFKSVDRGESWFRANQGLETTIPQRLALDPNEPRTLYAGTDFSGTFKTTDGGETWRPAGRGAPPMLRAEGIVNAADFTGGGVSPGEIVSIFARNAGPEQGVVAGLNAATGRLPVNLAGVEVFFNNTRGALFFVREDQINVQVPFEVAGLDEVNVRVVVNGVISNPVTVPVVGTNPGVFVIVNQDFSLNTADNPAAPGSVVQMFLTGQGVVTSETPEMPESLTGLPQPPMPPFPEPRAPLNVMVDGREARVRSKGLAPGFVGLLQVNFDVPMDAGPGAAEVEVTIGGNATGEPFTLFVE